MGSDGRKLRSPRPDQGGQLQAGRNSPRRHDAGHGRSDDLSRTAQKSRNLDDPGSISHRQGAGHGPTPLCRPWNSRSACEALRPHDALHADRQRSWMEVSLAPMGSAEPSSLAEAMNRLWAQFLPQIEERVANLELAAKAAAEGTLTSDLREQAHDAAHKLAGTLGTFGLQEGTELAREAEALYAAESPAMASENGRL